MTGSLPTVTRSAALLAALLVATSAPAPLAQVAPSAEHLVARLVATSTDPAALEVLWEELRADGQIPYRHGDHAVFLYRGEATRVFVAGDHTGWQPHAGSALARIPGTDVWYRTDRFPAGARIDYKLVVDEEYVLDPANPHVQVSGFGPNSELRMPGWHPGPHTVRSPEIPRGTLEPEQTLTSEALGLPITYRVYTPSGYETLSDLPVVYVTDGHEYADDDLGAAVIVLDNLVATRGMEPAIAVFIDPRIDGENRRDQLYLGNPAFAAFIAEELVATIDAAYRTRADREGRVILGTSWGGVFATYLGLTHPQTFGRLAIQSPAYWASEVHPSWPGPRLAEQFADGHHSFTVHLSTGTIHDGEVLTRRMRDAFAAGGHHLTYREVPEGHSWGNWRALLADVFATLLPPTGATGR
jgi:enterochelin esterase-like enzyme